MTVYVPYWSLLHMTHGENESMQLCKMQLIKGMTASPVNSHSRCPDHGQISCTGPVIGLDGYLQSRALQPWLTAQDCHWSYAKKARLPA